jgi:putative transport protein
MVHDVVELCRAYPQIVIFLAISIGYFVGKIKIHGFSFGATTGCLLTAIVIGQIGVEVPGILKTVGFALFIFAIGYKVGPQFFGGLKKEGLHYLWISLVVAFAGLATVVLLSKLFGFDQGTAAGLLGGAMTQSAVIGTAEGAIRHLAISAADKATLESNVAVAYAITYVFGTAGLIIFFKMLPGILKLDLKAGAKKLEARMSGGDETLESPALFSWHKRLDLRAYRVEKPELVGSTVKDVESLLPGKLAVERLKRGDKVSVPKPETVIQEGDVLAMVGTRDSFLKAEEIIGPETLERSAMDLVGENLEVCVTNRDLAGKTLGELDGPVGHGIFLRKITRQGHELPMTRDTVVHECDVMQLIGERKDVERAVKVLGYPERPTSATDLIIVGIGIVLGTLLGLLAVPVLGIPITLGVGGGVLVSGLVFGLLRSIHPTFGEMPGPAQWVFTDLGLNLFITCVGLDAGPKALHAIQTAGMSIFFAGIAVTLAPAIAGLIFGKLVLKLDDVLLFGALTGAETCTAALNAVKEECDSMAPVIGYTVTYAFGNVLLTVWGTVVVNLI